MPKANQGRITTSPARQASILDLPFVRNCTLAEQRAGRGKRIFWSVKPTGDWQKDCEIGELYAALALDYMVNADMTVLSWIATDMAHDAPSKCGIRAGFMNRIGRYAMAAERATRADGGCVTWRQH